MRIQYSPLGTFLYWISDLFMKMGKQIRNLSWWLNCYAYDLFPKWYFAVLYTQHLQLNCHHVLYINIQHKHLYTKETSKNPLEFLKGTELVTWPRTLNPVLWLVGRHQIVEEIVQLIGQVTSSVPCKDSNTNFRKVNCLLNCFLPYRRKRNPTKCLTSIIPLKCDHWEKKIPCFSFLQGIGKTNVVSCITQSFLQGSSLNICCTYKFM